MKVLDQKRIRLVALPLLVAAVAGLGSGCGLVVNLMHAGWGHMVPAEFEGLAARQVAVVCVSETNTFGPRPISELIARQVTALLKENVRKIEMIDQQRVDRWIDENDWNQVDYLEIGHGLGAETLVAIDIVSFRLHEGQTMYKGRAEADIAVYDLTADGTEVFRKSLQEIQFPANSGQHTTDISERAFRGKFVDVVANHIARIFYAYDFKEDFARDPTFIGR